MIFVLPAFPLSTTGDKIESTITQTDCSTEGGSVCRAHRWPFRSVALLLSIAEHLVKESGQN